MNIKLDKRSEALLKEMLRKNSHYGSVDIIINETVGYAIIQRVRKVSLIPHCELKRAMSISAMLVDG